MKNPMCSCTVIPNYGMLLSQKGKWKEHIETSQSFEEVREKKQTDLSHT